MQIPVAANISNSTSLGLSGISLSRNPRAGDNVSPVNSITSVGQDKNVNTANALGSQLGKKANAVESAASQFEELFVSLMLKQMRETLDEGLFGKESSDSFGAIFDMYMGKHLASSNPLGIGKAVSSYLKAGQNSEK